MFNVTLSYTIEILRKKKKTTKPVASPMIKDIDVLIGCEMELQRLLFPSGKAAQHVSISLLSAMTKYFLWEKRRTNCNGRFSNITVTWFDITENIRCETRRELIYLTNKYNINLSFGLWVRLTFVFFSFHIKKRRKQITFWREETVCSWQRPFLMYTVGFLYLLPHTQYLKEERDKKERERELVIVWCNLETLDDLLEYRAYHVFNGCTWLYAVHTHIYTLVHKP